MFDCWLRWRIDMEEFSSIILLTPAVISLERVIRGCLLFMFKIESVASKLLIKFTTMLRRQKSVVFLNNLHKMFTIFKVNFSHFYSLLYCTPFHDLISTFLMTVNKKSLRWSCGEKNCGQFKTSVNFGTLYTWDLLKMIFTATISRWNVLMIFL